MLSHFHPIPERYGQTDGQTELLYQYRTSVCSRAITIKIMKLGRCDSDFLKSVCQGGVVHEGCLVIFRTRGNLEASIVCWREFARWEQLLFNQAVADHVRHGAVDDLVLSQEDKPKRHQSACEISHGTDSSSLYKKIHSTLELMCFKRRRPQLLSEANHVVHLTPWYTTLSAIDLFTVLL